MACLSGSGKFKDSATLSAKTSSGGRGTREGEGQMKGWGRTTEIEPHAKDASLRGLINRMLPQELTRTPP